MTAIDAFVKYALSLASDFFLLILTEIYFFIRMQFLLGYTHENENITSEFFSAISPQWSSLSKLRTETSTQKNPQHV